MGVNAMLVIKVNLPDAEPVQALITAFADIFRPAIHANKLSLFTTDISKLGGLVAGSGGGFGGAWASAGALLAYCVVYGLRFKSQNA
jgi:hypothetical protein